MSSSSRDYYATLEIEATADQETIKKAYRRLALKYHPDRNKGDEKAAEAKFREIHEAYAILSDPQKRKDYDTYGANGIRDRPTFNANSADIFNMFNSFFGGGDPFTARGSFFNRPPNNMFGGGPFGARDPFARHDNFFGPSSPFGRSNSFNNNNSSRSKQHKVKTTISVTFQESVFGCAKQLSLEHYNKCSNCLGTGASSGRIRDTICSKCGGSGRARDNRGGLTITSTCTDCGGFGQKTANPCLVCAGSGKLMQVHEEEIIIPPGIGPNSSMKRVISPGQQEGGDEDLYEVTIEFTVE